MIYSRQPIKEKMLIFVMEKTLDINREKRKQKIKIKK